MVPLVVLVGAVDHAVVPALGGNLRQVGVERVLAEVAAVSGVAGVVGVVELPRVHDEVLDAERADEPDRSFQLGRQIGLVVRGHRQDRIPGKHTRDSRQGER
jgi:hypothetical protein